VEGATILVVDDDEEIRDLVCQFLEEDGYRCEKAGSGREVLQRLDPQVQLPDVMLLDLVMPDIDGYDVLEALRKNLLQEFPVLIVSAQRPDARVLTALDSELRDFIAKPFDLEELSIRIRRLIQRSPRFALTGKGCLRVYALGALRVYLDDRLLFDESWRNKPAKTIFKLLFTHRGRRYPKEVLSEELWPETDPGVAANRLRVAVSELRKALGDRSRREKGLSYISQQEGAYYFDPAAVCWSDTETFEDAVVEGKQRVDAGNLDDALFAYRRAEALYQGDFLRDDPFFEWTVPTRERLRETHLSMLGEAARIHALHGAPDEAASFCRKILRVEPWREEVYRRLMEYLAEAGRPHEALRAFEECRRVLRAEVEAEPSPETIRLRDSISRVVGKPVVSG
jgi:two-component SAPR family response regulator